MKKPVEWIRSWFTAKQETLVIDQAKITEILPHQEKWALVQSVAITDGKAVGELVLGEDICRGHVIAGVLIPPGCIWYDAAAQLLGVILHQDQEVLSRLGPNKMLGASGYGPSEFRRPFHPGDKIIIETTTEVDYDDRHGFFRVSGGKFYLKLPGEKRARVTIDSVTLTPMSKEDLLRG